MKGGGNCRRGSMLEKQTYPDGGRLQAVPFTLGAPGRHNPTAYNLQKEKEKASILSFSPSSNIQTLILKSSRCLSTVGRGGGAEVEKKPKYNKGKPSQSPARCRPPLAGGLELHREPARDARRRAQQPPPRRATAGL